MSELMHIGQPRRSGRYPWGSGKNPFQSSIGFLGSVDELTRQGLSQVEIAKGLGLTTGELRDYKKWAKNIVWHENRNQVLRLRDKGMSNVKIGQRMGINESVVRSYLNPIIYERRLKDEATFNMLKETVDKVKYLDVGKGVENYVGVSRTHLNSAIRQLVDIHGYKIIYFEQQQMGAAPGRMTTIKTLVSPDGSWEELIKKPDLIQPIMGRSDDFGRTYSVLGMQPVQSVNSKRVMIRYAEDGGSLQDGVIELRRGVEELNLGGKLYAQVRIGVDDTHYMKGMAIFTDNHPDGIDIIYNTNKKRGTPMMKVMKEMEKLQDGSIDKDNPFGATIAIQRGAINVVGSITKPHEEGTWDKWSNTISSQVLSKQPVSLAIQQLGIAYQLKQEEFNKIMQLTNPVVKKLLLDKFADSCDSDSVHLKAAALPRQAQKVLLPVVGLKETEIYAPSFKNGETVVLIRHPHGGTFEIPQLKVNNKSKAGEAVMKGALDAVGINPKVAQILSGADFDGDTVIVIPNPHGAIRRSSPLKGLEGFDPIEMYPPVDGMRTIDGGVYDAKTAKVVYGPKGPRSNKDMQMGIVSNLITDMTIAGADLDEIARAVRHSMVVIDSEKHHLNYRLSYDQNGIAALAARYQGRASGGAATIVSRAKSPIYVPDRMPGAHIGRVSAKTGEPVKDFIDPRTGEKLYTQKGKTKLKTTTRIVKREPSPDKLLPTETVSRNDDGTFTITRVTETPTTIKTTRMAETKDPHTLSSGHPMETVYANHASQLKTLANIARKETLSIQTLPRSQSAREIYAAEAQSLESKLRIAEMNPVRERQAQIIARVVSTKKLQDNPPMDRDDVKKIRTQATAAARARMEAKKDFIEITPKEWEAIQANAVSKSVLERILANTDLDIVKQYATPRQDSVTLSSAQLKRAQQMMNSFTPAEIAQSLGISVSLLMNELSK